MLGVDGIKGCIADMRDLGIWDTYQVKTQTIKTAIESAGNGLCGKCLRCRS